MPDYEEIEGWRVHAHTDGGLRAYYRERGLTHMTAVRDGCIEADLDEERGGLSAYLTCTIPIPVIIRLLESVGYRVTREGEG